MPDLLKEMESYLQLDPNTFKKTVEKEPLDVLREREIQLEMFIREAKSQPIHQAKFITLSQLVKQEIPKRETEQQEKHKKREEEWMRIEVPKHLNDLRFIPNCATTLNLKAGIYSSNDIPEEWKKVDSSLTVTVQTQTGRSLKIDLLKLISPESWRQIFAHPLLTFFFPLEVGGALKRGKHLGIWRSPESYDEERQIVPIIHDSYLAIRMV